MCATTVSSPLITSDPASNRTSPGERFAPPILRWRGNEAYEASFDAMREFTAQRDEQTRKRDAQTIHGSREALINP